MVEPMYAFTRDLLQGLAWIAGFGLLVSRGPGRDTAVVLCAVAIGGLILLR